MIYAFVAAFLMMVSISVSGAVEAAKYSCTVSSDPDQNTGHCRALSSGNGDMCFTFGTGPACSGTSGFDIASAEL